MVGGMMDLSCEMCRKKIGTLTHEKDAVIKIDMIVCKQCDNKLWDKLIRLRQRRK